MSDIPTLELPPLQPPEPPPEPPAPPPVPAAGGQSRRRLVAALAAVVVLLVGLPLALLLTRHGAGPDQATPGPTTPPAATASAEPSAVVSTTAAPVTEAPDGRIPLSVLRNATLDVPAWPVDNLTGLSGRLRFVDGEVLVPPDDRFPVERHIVIGTAIYADLDADGAQETLAMLGCYIQGGSQQLVAFDRDAAGRIITMGTVVATTGEIRVIDEAAVQPRQDGQVAVRVADFQRCCGDETPQLWQVRTYAWNGSRFVQAGGPTAFPVNPSVTDTAIAAGDLLLGAPVDGVRHGTVTVTVSHVRGALPHHLTLAFALPAGVQRDAASWPSVRVTGPSSFELDVRPPAAGGSTSYSFAFRRDAATSGGSIDVELVAKNAAGVGLSEANHYDGSVTITVRN